MPSINDPKAANLVLVTVSGGVASVYTQGAVRVAVVDFDNLSAGDAPPTLDRHTWQALVSASGLEPGEDVLWAQTQPLAATAR